MADESLTAPARAVYTKRNFRASVDVNDYKLKEGWLEKKGKLLAGWQKRYFRASGPYLRCYHTPPTGGASDVGPGTMHSDSLQHSHGALQSVVDLRQVYVIGPQGQHHSVPVSTVPAASASAAASRRTATVTKMQSSLPPAAPNVMRQSSDKANTFSLVARSNGSVVMMLRSTSDDNGGASTGDTTEAPDSAIAWASHLNAIVSRSQHAAQGEREDSEEEKQVEDADEDEIEDDDDDDDDDDSDDEEEEKAEDEDKEETDGVENAPGAAGGSHESASAHNGQQRTQQAPEGGAEGDTDTSGFLQEDGADSEVVVFEIFENERKQPFRGWGSSYPGYLLPTDPGKWSDRTMRDHSMAEFIDATGWSVDTEGSWCGGSCDAQGWTYAVDFWRFNRQSTYASSEAVHHFVRRRRWVQTRHMPKLRRSGLALSGNAIGGLSAETSDSVSADSTAAKSLTPHARTSASTPRAAARTHALRVARARTSLLIAERHPTVRTLLNTVPFAADLESTATSSAGTAESSVGTGMDIGAAGTLGSTVPIHLKHVPLANESSLDTNTREIGHIRSKMSQEAAQGKGAELMLTGWLLKKGKSSSSWGKPVKASSTRTDTYYSSAARIAAARAARAAASGKAYASVPLGTSASSLTTVQAMVGAGADKARDALSGTGRSGLCRPRSSIKRRCFVLSGSALRYFVDKKQQQVGKARGEIDLNTVLRMEMTMDDTAPEMSVDLVTASRTWTIYPLAPGTSAPPAPHTIASRAGAGAGADAGAGAGAGADADAGAGAGAAAAAAAAPAADNTSSTVNGFPPHFVRWACAVSRVLLLRPAREVYVAPELAELALVSRRNDVRLRLEANPLGLDTSTLDVLARVSRAEAGEEESKDRLPSPAVGVEESAEAERLSVRRSHRAVHRNNLAISVDALVSGDTGRALELLPSESSDSDEDDEERDHVMEERDLDDSAHDRSEMEAQPTAAKPAAKRDSAANPYSKRNYVAVSTTSASGQVGIAPPGGNGTDTLGDVPVFSTRPSAIDLGLAGDVTSRREHRMSLRSRPSSVQSSAFSPMTTSKRSMVRSTMSRNSVISLASRISSLEAVVDTGDKEASARRSKLAGELLAAQADALEAEAAEAAEAEAEAAAAQEEYEKSMPLRQRSDSGYRHEVGWMAYRMCERFRDMSRGTFGMGAVVADRLRPMLSSLVLNISRQCGVGWDTGRHPALVDAIIADYKAGKGRLMSHSDNIARQLRPAVYRHLVLDRPFGPTPRKSSLLTSASSLSSASSVTEVACPSLRVVMLVVGSRGDVQPFIALGKRMRDEHGHRVRIATHAVFADWVRQHGLDFYPIAGDPKALMAMQVNNEFLSYAYIKDGLTTKRTWIRALLDTSWDACTRLRPPGEGGADSEGEGEGDDAGGYTADAIIGNPPAMSQLHIAERLGVPCHYMFTMPWSRTAHFKSPFFTGESPPGPSRKNYSTYSAVDMAIWYGTRDLVNNWRVRTLGLERVPRSAHEHSLQHHRRVPFTYCFSEALLPRPPDWGPWIDVVGFWFLSNANPDWDPPPELLSFLESGPPPVFIGFGSIVVDDPDALTNTVVAAVKSAGCRAIIQKGWAGMTPTDLPEEILLIGAAPHDWLFPRMAAVVHHGGAGTTSAGLRVGRPTVIVPFFGDQFFWGRTVQNMGIGVMQPHAKLTVANLADALQRVLSDDVRDKAQRVGEVIMAEDGVGRAIRSFHRQLPLQLMLCDHDPSRLASLYSEEYDLKLHPESAKELQLPTDGLRPYHWVNWAGEGARRGWPTPKIL